MVDSSSSLPGHRWAIRFATACMASREGMVVVFRARRGRGAMEDFVDFFVVQTLDHVQRRFSRPFATSTGL